MFPHKADLHKRYSRYSTERLLSIYYNRSQYTTEALEVVKAELHRRNVSPREVDLYLDKEDERRRAMKSHAYVPLTFWEKSLFFFAWFAPWFLGKAFRLNYSEDGYLFKQKQSGIFARAGFAFLMLDAFATVSFNLSNLASMAVLVLFFLIFYGAEKHISFDAGREIGS